MGASPTPKFSPKKDSNWGVFPQRSDKGGTNLLHGIKPFLFETGVGETAL